MRKMHLLLSVLLLFASCKLLSAQTAPAAQGTPAFGTYSSGPDVINIGNLNMHLTIPVLNKPGRAGMNFVYNLTYDNSIWSQVGSSGNLSWQPTGNWGWGGLYQASYVTYDVTTSSGSCGQYGQYTWQSWTFTNLTYVDSGGVHHPSSSFQGSYINSPGSSNYCPTPGANPPPNIPVTTSDGSGYTIYPTLSAGSLSAYVTDKYARTYNTPTYANGGAGSTEASYSATDANGNEITGVSGVYTDTTGKTALTVAGASPNPMTFTFNNPSGGTSKVTVNFSAPVTIRTNFGCSGVNEYQASNQYLVTSIVLPDNSEYQFTYEPTPQYSGDYTGRVASIKLPSGGTISYQYSSNPNAPGGISCTDDGNTYVQRKLNADSDSLASTVAYARALNGGTLPSGLACTAPSCTEVVDGYNNYSEYNFIPPYIPTTGPAGPLGQYYETSRKVYQGSASGTPVLSRTTCYNGATNCGATSLTFPVSSVDRYNTLNGIYTDGATATYDSNGNLTGQTIYDFGSGSSRGSQLRRETWTYGYSIVGLRTLDTVYDGSGSMAAKTESDYDQSAPASSSGVPQHISVSGARGNLTTIKRYLASNTSISQSFTYEDTGVALTSTDPSGATTTYSYDPTFVYNQGVNYPTPSSGVALSTSESYDTSYSGLPKKFIDMNTQPTTIYSYDSSLRPTEIDYPDGGKATLQYTPTSVTANVLQATNSSATTETEVDGYGRKSRVFIANGQSGNSWYQQDYCYDANGNVGFVSYKYQSAGPGSAKVCSGSGDTYSYDALGRLSSVTHSDGTKLQDSYWGRATEAQDENNVSRITQIDGMGRPSIICEISSNSSMPGSGSPVSCGTDFSGTGFTTSYAYNLATGTTTVTQGAQTRTFQTDWLGRTTSVTEPERGTTTYSYAYNSTGLQVTRQRPQANQPSSSTLTTTTTQYDVLGRPISVTYSDGTVGRSYAYDAGAGWGTQSNLKGRLSRAGLANGTVATVYGYDAMGRVTNLGECDPSNCGTTNYSTSYSYDYAGNLLTSQDGAVATDTYTFSLANEVQSVTSSVNDSNHPPNLLSSVQNGPFGPVSWHLGNGLNGVRTYDSMGRNNGGWICNGSTSAYCSGGSQVYGYTLSWSGSRVTGECDTVLNQCMGFGYDDFNRIASRVINSGTAQNFTYVYDRWGNRWQQNLTAGSGPAPQLSFNTSTNQVSTGGYGYDAAGNLTSDGNHTYTYDAEGNTTKVDSGTTAAYTYDALNQRVRIDGAGFVEEFIFNPAGQHTSAWNPGQWADEAWAYSGSSPLAYYENGTTQFEHQDWLGTERMRTDVSGNTVGSFASLPFGDGYTASGDAWDAYHFAGMDQDTTSNDHAQFRGYSNMAGRWMSPDPYDGSYDPTNPQSFNRYAYVLNNPLTFIDPRGMECAVSGGGTSSVTAGGETDTTTDPVAVSCSTDDFTTNIDGGAGAVFLTLQNLPTAPSNPCARSALARRIATGIQGAANLGIAGVKIAGVGAADILLVGGGAAGTVFTGGASDVAAGLAAGAVTTYGVTSASGQAVSGFGQLYSAFTGNTEAGEAVGQGGDILAGPIGGIGTLALGGSAATAQQNAQLEGTAMAGNALVGSKGFGDFLTNAADLTLSVLGMGGSGCH